VRREPRWPVAHAVPVHRCAELVASLTGASPSPGFVHGMIARAANAVAAANLRIRALLTLAYAVCCDETPIRVGPGKAKKYLLVACTRLFTWYMLGCRGMATFKKFTFSDLTGVIVHDRYQNNDSAELGEHTHQLCCSHYADLVVHDTFLYQLRQRRGRHNQEVGVMRVMPMSA
jgi:transposase